LVEPVVDPETGDLDSTDKVRIPRRQVCKLIVKLAGLSYSERELGYPYSQEEERLTCYEDYLPEFGLVISKESFNQALILERDYETIVENAAREMICPGLLSHQFKNDKGKTFTVEPLYDLDPVLYKTVVGFVDDLLYEDGKFDVGELVESFKKNKAFYYGTITQEEALLLKSKVDSFVSHFDFKDKSLTKVRNSETAKIISTLSRITTGHSVNY
jgi:hypothetical protein